MPNRQHNLAEPSGGSFPHSKGTAMFKTALIAASLTLAMAPIAALAAGEDGQFTHKGVTYSYTATDAKTGETVIRGTAYAGTVPFELHIHKKTVTGTFNDKPVEFTMDQVKKLNLAPAK